MNTTPDSPSPAQFRAEHGDATHWSVADHETYEHLVQTQDVQLVDRVLTEHRVVDGPTQTAAA